MVHVSMCRILQVVLIAILFLAYFAAGINESLEASNDDIILIGPGIDSPQLIFPTRYFAVLHRSPNDIVQIDEIETGEKIEEKLANKRNNDVEKPQRCRLWAQNYNETQFCIRLKRKTVERIQKSRRIKVHENGSSNDDDDDDQNRSDQSPKIESLSDLLDESIYCDDEWPKNYVDSDTNDTVIYYLTIVRYKLHYQSQCSPQSETRRFMLTITRADVVIYRRSLFAEGGDDRNGGDKRNAMLDRKFILHSERCDCPRDDWSSEMRCERSAANRRLMRLIDEDLERFKPSIDFDSLLSQAIKRFGVHTRSYAFCVYQIIANKLYRQCFGEYVGFARFADEILLSICRKTPLPDTEFVVNLGDWPLSPLAANDNNNDAEMRQNLAIFSWCGSTEAADLVLPTYELTESILHAQSRVSTDIISTLGRQSLPFARKRNRLFWRGRDSNRARLELIEKSRTDPSAYNVSITNFFFFRDEAHRYVNDDDDDQSDDNDRIRNSKIEKKRERKIPYVPFDEFFRYRYQLNLDGTVAAYRFPFLLAGNSLVLKQRSKYYEYFYRLLRENEHYVPIAADIGDLSETLRDLIDDDDDDERQRNDQANRNKSSKDKNDKIKKQQQQRRRRRQTTKHIIWNARRFVLTHLMPEHVYCYYRNLIIAYTNLLAKPLVKRRANVTLVTDDRAEREHYPENECICDTNRVASSATHSNRIEL